jgi:hypothetical protein
MKNKLWAFGDSYTAGVLPDIDHFPPYIEYLKYLGISKEEFPLGWPYQFANKLNLEPSVVAVGGSSNQETFLTFSFNSDKIKKNDIVIINWTYFHRFLWALENGNYPKNSGYPFGKFKRASYDVPDTDLLKITPKEVFKHFGINKSLGAWIEEIKAYENIINTLSNSIGFDVFYWSAVKEVYFENKNVFGDSKYICNDVIQEFVKNMTEDTHVSGELFFQVMEEKYQMTSILQETNGVVDDSFHRGIEGNKIQAELFYNWIVKNRRYGLYNSK